MQELMYSEDEVTKKLKILKQKEIESEGKKVCERLWLINIYNSIKLLIGNFPSFHLWSIKSHVPD